MSIDAGLKLLNPYNEEFESVNMRLNMETEITFELLEDFTLIGNLKTANITVQEFKTFF